MTWDAEKRLGRSEETKKCGTTLHTTRAPASPESFVRGWLRKGPERGSFSKRKLTSNAMILNSTFSLLKMS